MDKKSLSVRQRIVQEFYKTKDRLKGRVPTRMEFFTYMDDTIYQYCMGHAKENRFTVSGFLNKRNELSEDEKLIYSGIGQGISYFD